MTEYTDDPPVFVFGDTGTAISRGRFFIEASGGRVLGGVDIEAAQDCLAAAPPAPILLELEGESDAESLALLLDRVRIAAEQGQPAIVVAPPALTDLISACAFHPAIEHLCEPRPIDRAMALATIRARHPTRLHDVNREGESLMQHAILHQLSEEVGRIAGILASLSDDDDSASSQSVPPSEGEAEIGIDAAQIRAIIRARRLRDQFFRSELFADPAWDMLLDLMAARIEKTRVAVSSLCIAAAVPATTALRWIKALTDRGLFARSADPQDGRRVYIELSDEAARSVAAYLRAAQRLAPTVI